MDKYAFSVGSWVVYPSHGVGKLEAIEKFDINGEKVEFFVISFARNKLVLKLPVQKATSIGLRSIFTKKEMDAALLVMQQKGAKKKMMWSKRAQEYEKKINSGDPIAVAEVLRDLYRSSDDQTQSFSERQIFKHAMERFSSEMSVLENIAEEDAVKKVESVLSAA